MKSGKLNRLIEIQTFKATDDGVGGFTETYETLCAVWAAIEDATGKKYRQAQQQNAVITHRIVIRYRTDVNRTQSILYNGRRFDILYIINEGEANKFLNLFCSEKI